MKVMHLLETLNSSGGGLPAAVSALVRAQIEMGFDVCVATLDGDRNALPIDVPMVSQNRFSAAVKDLKSGTPNFFVHLHGVWNLRLWNETRQLKSVGAKVILSPHGQLMPGLLRADPFLKKAKKRIYRDLILRACLDLVDCFHAVCPAERRLIEAIGLNTPCVSIYNFIDSTVWRTDAQRFSEADWQRQLVLTFLGRIDRRKGVLDLAKAFFASQTERNLLLRIVGPEDDLDAHAQLSRLKSYSRTGRTLELLPASYGNRKLAVVDGSAFIILPSYSEVIGLVNIEACLLKRCAITTTSANIPELAENGGIEIDPGFDSCRSVIERAASMTFEEYRHRCSQLYDWSRREFDPRAIKDQWVNMYRLMNG